MLGSWPPYEIVIVCISLLSSGSLLTAKFKCFGAIVFFLFSSQTLPASSIISAVRYSRTPDKKIPAELENLSLYLPCLNILFNLPVGNNVPAFTYPETGFDLYYDFPDFLLEPTLFSPFFPATGILNFNLFWLYFFLITK